MRYYFLPLLALLALRPVRAVAQTVTAPVAASAVVARPAPAYSPAVLARIRAVETGLLPNVPVLGQPGYDLLARMKYHRVPGLSIAVVHNYQVEWAKAYGLADTVRRVPATPETLFSAGSISKLATAVAALKLVEERKLTLDAPINTYLKSWRLADNNFTRQQPVTLRRLLSHTGGTSQSAYFGFVPGKKPLPSVVDILSGQPAAECRPVVVNQLPGQGFQYSGGGYLVTQLAMTDTTGQDFTTLIERLLFKPLGMRSATFAQPLPPALAARAAGAYSENAWFKGMPYVYPQQAPAGLYATPTDLARLLIEIQQAYRGRGRVLSQASARTMLTPVADISTGDYREQMGLGAFLLQRADQFPTDDQTRYFEHTGVNAGFVAYLLGSVAGGEGVVVMMNNNNGASELGKEVRRAVAQVYAWPGALLPAIRPAARPATQLDQYAGRYRRGPDEVAIFRREGDHLSQRIGQGAAIGAFPVGATGDTVAFTDFPLRAVFERDAQGRVSGYRLLGAPAANPRLAPTDLIPGELLRLGRLPEARAAYRDLKLNESQLTYLIYDLLNPRQYGGPQLPAAQTLLTLAEEVFPKSGIVQARWGDYYAALGDPARARAAYEAVLRLDPTDGYAKERLAEMR